MSDKKVQNVTTQEAEETEVESLRQENEDLWVAYSLLHDACESAVNCHDIIIRTGTMRSMVAMVEALQLAMHSAELIVPHISEAEEFDGCIYCSVCERFFGVESERQGRCLYCEALGLLIK